MKIDGFRPHNWGIKMSFKPKKTATGYQGYHQFKDDQGNQHGSFEIWWFDENDKQGEQDLLAGWYWWPCFPGCLPDGETVGPFETSYMAYHDAVEQQPEINVR